MTARVFNRIHFRNLQGDVTGGVTAAIVSLPMALAFGVASGVGPVAGLYGAICIGFFAALFGGTPTLISEPTGPMTAVMTAVVIQMTASAGPGNETLGLAMAFTSVMMAGVFQILFGVLRLGKYITLMPYTVISGFMSGIGVILIVLQLAPFLGHGSQGGVVKTLQALPGLLTQIQPLELILGLLTVAILFLTPRKVRKVVPAQLIALVVGTLVSFVIVGDGASIRRIGEIPMALPTLQLPVLTAVHLREILVNGAILGMLGCIDSLLTSVVADSLTRTQHDSDKELIGQGIGNLMSGLIGGLPGAGATMGTVTNIQAGGRTAVSGLVRAGLLLMVVVAIAPLVEPVPLTVLAGIALKVGFDIIDWAFLKRAHNISIKATLVMYGVLLLTVFVDLIVAVGVGVFVANILTIQRMSELQSNSVRTIDNADDQLILSDRERSLIDQGAGRVLLFHLSGPMIFGVAKAIEREHSAMKDCDVLVVDLQDVPMLGVTSSLAIENAILDALDKGLRVYLVGATGQTARRLKKLGLAERLPEDRWLISREMALEKAVAEVEAMAVETLDSRSPVTP
ncbi:MAG: SulP family inorganic anion transporter [Cyanobacteria bacterium]|nr:SulP family inorganic anion transporter [Cyanobacteriota bacterium]